MAQEDKHSDAREAVQPDEATQLKKAARRRLIGAAALALLAAIVLPMVMDKQPAPPLKDIQVRIPSPDEGTPQRLAPKPRAAPAAESAAPARLIDKAEIKPIAKAEQKTEPGSESKPETKPEQKPETRPETRVADAVPDMPPGSAEAWEVQLGAYQDAGRVRNLLAKLKDLGVPTYTEKVETANGPRTRVRAGPFPGQEAAEKARGRIGKIIGVDGTVARKP